MNKSVQKLMNHFAEIKEILGDERFMSDYPDYHRTQDLLLESLRKLSVKDIVKNINEMTDEQLDYLAYNVYMLAEAYPELITFFNELGQTRNNKAIQYEIKPFL